MGLRYKIDVLPELKECGYSSFRLRQEKILSQSTIQKLRTGTGISWENIETLCALLNRQPGDLIEYVEDKRPEV